jgi:LmbE family N-acetylglucosaminyl deacetylase
MKKVVLSVAAHGSDAEFMAGGTLARLAADGHDVFVLVAAGSGRSSLQPPVRDVLDPSRAEAEAAAKALGARRAFLLGYADGELSDVQPSVLRGQVMRIIRQVKAGILFSWDPHAPLENHPDHRAIARAASDAARLAHLPHFHPEHWDEAGRSSGTPAPHRVSEWYWYSKAGWQSSELVDITDTIDQKLAALRAYPSQTALLLDEFLAEARLSNNDETYLAEISPEDHEAWIEMIIRAINSKLGSDLGVAYAEAFRYESLESRDLLYSL